MQLPSSISSNISNNFYTKSKKNYQMVIKPALFNADDSLFFLQPSIAQVQVLKIVFSFFYKISGLQVNMRKSTLVFSSTEQQLANSLASYMGCTISTFPVTYLGLHLSDKRLAKTDYLTLIHKIAARLSGSSANSLFLASKLVLTNVVLSSLPIYFMTAFILPKWVIDEIDTIRRNLLWKGSDANSKKKYILQTGALYVGQNQKEGSG
jgi:hypothetical protein